MKTPQPSELARTASSATPFSDNLTEIKPSSMPDTKKHAWGEYANWPTSM